MPIYSEVINVLAQPTRARSVVRSLSLACQKKPFWSINLACTGERHPPLEKVVSSKTRTLDDEGKTGYETIKSTHTHSGRADDIAAGGPGPNNRYRFDVPAVPMMPCSNMTGDIHYVNSEWRSRKSEG